MLRWVLGAWLLSSVAAAQRPVPGPLLDDAERARSNEPDDAERARPNEPDDAERARPDDADDSERARPDDAERAERGPLEADSAEDPVATEEALRWTALRELLLEDREERQQEAWALAGVGLLGLVGGLAMAVAGRDDAQWLSNGLTTLSFAAINVPLGLLQLDRRGMRRDAIARIGPPASFDTLVAQAIDVQRRKRASYAINGALDVVYMLVGALLVTRAERLRRPSPSRGAGWAMLHQGAALLALDLVGMWRATRRLRRARALRGL